MAMLVNGRQSACGPTPPVRMGAAAPFAPTGAIQEAKIPLDAPPVTR